MNSESRQGKILERVARAGFASVSDLAEELDVSSVTVHRDLKALAKNQMLLRVRGGAKSFSLHPHEILTEYVSRESQNRGFKHELGNYAANLIPDRSVIFLDGSSTCSSLFNSIRRLSAKQLTVVTNSLAIASIPHDRSIGMVLTPGDVDQSLRATVGSWAQEFLEGIHIDLAFISGAALSLGSGLMTTQRSIADMGRAAISRADQTFALVDSSKFDSQALLAFAEAGEVNLLLTDSFLPDDRVIEYRKEGWNLERSPRLEGET